MRDAGEVLSFADWGVCSSHLVSDGVVRPPAAGVIEAARTTDLATAGSSVLVSDAAFEFRAVTADEVLAQLIATQGVGTHFDMVDTSIQYLAFQVL